MKVKDLSGRNHTWNLSGHIPLGSDENKTSSYHRRARELLQSEFPMEQRLEEVSLPGSRRLRCDFLLPNRMLMVECHGEQHYRFIKHFHKNVYGFLEHQKRDRLKAEWCLLNKITYCELPYDESDEQWRDRLFVANLSRATTN
jgi:hypothetical protein